MFVSVLAGLTALAVTAQAANTRYDFKIVSQIIKLMPTAIFSTDCSSDHKINITSKGDNYFCKIGSI
jgi:hypothetical protein